MFQGEKEFLHRTIQFMIEKYSSWMKMKDAQENDEHFGNLHEITQDLEKLKEYIERTKASEVGVQPEVIKTEADTVNTVSANQRAKRWAMMNFDKWNEVTGFVDPHISYYDEITALIEDAVEFGYGVALKQPLKEIMKVIKKSEGSL